MDWIDIKGLQDEEQQIIETYNKINEETRLNLSNSSSIEFLTNTKYVENMLENKSSILELGAGTGVYSIYFANKVLLYNFLQINSIILLNFSIKIIYPYIL